MKLQYTFEGVKLTDGKYPRAIVLAMYPLADVPSELSNVKITISLPVNDCEQSIAAIAAASIGTAQRLVNESEAQKWVESCPLGTLVELASSPGAAEARHLIDPDSAAS